ncbi:MAG: hypothetical protein ACYC35_12170 [Pirellulales bacterium]
MRWLTVAAVATLALSCPPAARSDYKDDIRYSALAKELGALVPTGAGVKVAQVEARNDGGSPPDNTPNCVPDLTLDEFAGKTITVKTAGADTSGHATTVGKLFYGKATSTAPGIQEIDSYWADDWLRGGFLKSGQNPSPPATSVRVFNHSWIGSSDSLTVDALKRVDYLVETYDAMQIVAVNNGTGLNQWPYLSHAFNAITVGRSNGSHVTGTTSVADSQGIYLAGRVKPDIVSPQPSTSAAAPTVAAAAALLIETAHQNPALSLNGSYAVNGQTIYHGETSEVVKAALMAGARRADVVGYAVNTANGLSDRYGAGELDIFNSYHIIAAGKQPNREQAGAGAYVGPQGFDYDTAFLRGDSATYHFMTGSDPNRLIRLAASLAWNIDISGPVAGQFNNTASLANFDLSLYSVGAQGDVEIASSKSTLDNTENLWTARLAPSTEYSLQVRRADSGAARDYGLAWQLVDDLAGDIDLDGDVDIFDVATLQTKFGIASGATWKDGDFTNDGKVDIFDIAAMQANFGSGVGGAANAMNAAAASLGPVSAVPEPNSLVPAGFALAVLLGWAFRAMKFKAIPPCQDPADRA